MCEVAKSFLAKLLSGAWHIIIGYQLQLSNTLYANSRTGIVWPNIENPYM